MTFQAKLTTKLEKYSIDDAVIELKNSTSRDHLDDVVKSILKQADKFDEKQLGTRQFEFVVGGRILRLSIEEHLKLYSDEIDANEILSEKLLEIEYTLSLNPPEPLDAIPHDDWVSCIDANDSYIISGSYDNSIRIFSIQNRKNLITIADAHEKPVTRVKFLKFKDTSNKNELYFISCGHDEVSIMRRFNTKSLKIEVVSICRGHNRSVNCIDACDDLFATGSFDKTLRIWTTRPEEPDDGIGESDGESSDNKKSKKQKIKSSEKSVSNIGRSAMMTLTGHQESVTGVKWLGSCNEYNSIATCSTDRTICIWDVEVGECKRRVTSAKPLLGIDFCSERNLIVSGSCDRHIRLWDARAPDNATAKAAYTSHKAWISSVAFGPSSANNFISGGYDNLVKLWDLRSPKACLYDLIGHHDKVLDVNWTNSSYVLSGSADSTLKMFSNK